MRRDLDLGRRMLLEVEVSDADPRIGLELDYASEYEHDTVSENVRLLDKAGLVEAQSRYTFGPDGYTWAPLSLTWLGHDLLDAARNETIWKDVTDRLRQVGAGITFALLKERLEDAIRTIVLSGQTRATSCDLGIDGCRLRRPSSWTKGKVSHTWDPMARPLQQLEDA